MTSARKFPVRNRGTPLDFKRIAMTSQSYQTPFVAIFIDVIGTMIYFMTARFWLLN
jgi:Mg/Co/Ni transporter MgtE